MPVVPAMITGGMILAIKNLLVNYFGMGVDSGTARSLMLMIFDAGFAFLPVYVGYTLSFSVKNAADHGRLPRRDLDRSALCHRNRHRLLRHRHSAGFHSSTVIPIVLGVFFMYYVQKVLKKIIPEALTFFLTPLITMIVVVPLR